MRFRSKQERSHRTSTGVAYRTRRLRQTSFGAAGGLRLPMCASFNSHAVFLSVVPMFRSNLIQMSCRSQANPIPIIFQTSSQSHLDFIQRSCGIHSALMDHFSAAIRRLFRPHSTCLRRSSASSVWHVRLVSLPSGLSADDRASGPAASGGA